MSVAKMLTNYGSARKGRVFPIIKEGLDWVLLRVKRKPIYVFRSFVRIGQFGDMEEDRE